MKKWHMKSILKEILIGAIVLFVVANIVSYVRQPKLASTSLPQLNVSLLDGSVYRLEKGKPLVLHFWATWCPTCKLEASNIEAISEKYNVLSIAVNSGETQKIQAYMKERGLTFPVVNDSKGKLAEAFQVEAYPTTFIYDAQGEIAFTEVGYTSTLGFLARIKSLL